ncbi:MAG TPA: cytidylate kinase-like family protein [Candidatus Lachnoclostridium stercorigallinarum]|uniref:Cytidylate kinase-like family protein n=1 Tax=Candidatus Lachnoclostridium stercorigallinarum TaxID=2838634 RepID=A0A9D2GJI1_9FIRM|nr:cytidylate kinase-like family protein [Candidatus Lachnoclostridium stercorigallinarum]
MKNFVVTIARGFGSGGRQIAAKLADELGIHSYDNRILKLAAQYSGYPEHYFREADETLQGNLIEKQLLALPKKFHTSGHLSRFVSDDRLFDFQKIIIEKLADTESCIIVGKCADYILKDYDNVVSVYVEAPRAYCLQRVLERMDDITLEEADELITRTDKYRADYYKYYTGGNYWTNPVNYDITINNARLGDEKSVQLIIETMRIKFGEEWYENYMKSIGKM